MFFQKAYKSQNILATIVSIFEAENLKKTGHTVSNKDNERDDWMNEQTKREKNKWKSERINFFRSGWSGKIFSRSKEVIVNCITRNRNLCKHREDLEKIFLIYAKLEDTHVLWKRKYPQHSFGRFTLKPGSKL